MTADHSFDEALEARIADREAFEARFPPEAFGPIFQALNVEPTPENRFAILDCLEQSFSGKPVKKPSVAERRKELKGLRDALALVLRAAHRPPGAAFLPWTLGDLVDKKEKFAATLQRLHRGVAEQLRKLEVKPARRGPKPKTIFRDFTPDLVWVYEKLTGEEAKKPYWLDDSARYGGAFYLFAVAVWECLRERLPQLKDALPDSEVAVAQELRRHWPSEGTTAG